MNSYFIYITHKCFHYSYKIPENKRVKKPSDYVELSSGIADRLDTGKLFLMGHNRMSLRTVVGLVVMQDLGFAVTLCKDGWRDLGCIELLCSAPEHCVRIDSRK